MADEDKAVKEGQVPADPPAVEPSAQTFQQATAHRDVATPPDAKSEWTASDFRGPLSRADEQGRDAGIAEGKQAPTAGPAISEPPKPLKPGDIAETKTDDAETKPDGKPVVGEVRQESVRPDAPSPYTHYPSEPKRPLWAVAAGIVIGAAIGAGSAAFVYRSVQGDVMSDEVTRLSARVDKLEKQPAKPVGDGALKQELADLENKVMSLSKSNGAPSAPDLGPLQSKIAGLQSSVDALKNQVGNTKSLDAKLSGLEAAVAGMKSQASSAQAGVAAMQSQQKQLTGKVMMPALAVAADSLVQQIGLGQPYAAQVDALAALGADPAKIAVLRENAASGVPSAKVLAAKFEPLADPIATGARPAGPNAGFVDRLKNGMLGLVAVRRADDLSGSDPASRVARIKADLARDDVAGAISAWNGLPAEAKAKSEAWRALAKTHADAMSAARGLQREAIAALGAKKS